MVVKNQCDGKIDLLSPSYRFFIIMLKLLVILIIIIKQCYGIA